MKLISQILNLYNLYNQTTLPEEFSGYKCGYHPIKFSIRQRNKYLLGHV